MFTSHPKVNESLVKMNQNWTMSGKERKARSGWCEIQKEDNNINKRSVPEKVVA